MIQTPTIGPLKISEDEVVDNSNKKGECGIGECGWLKLFRASKVCGNNKHLCLNYL